MRHRHHISTVAACLLLVTQFGCGGGDNPSQTAGNPLDGKLEGTPASSQNTQQSSAGIQQVSSTAGPSLKPNVVQTASLERDKLDMDDLDSDAPSLANEEVKIQELKEGSAEWSVREITRLKVQALPKTENVDELRKARAARNKKIIQLAMEEIGRAHV